MTMQIPPQNVAALRKLKSVKLATLRPACSSVYIAFKETPGTQTPWNSPLVRQAVALAIDRNAIVTKLLKGVPVSYPFLAPGDPGYDPSIKPYPFDPAKARRLSPRPATPTASAPSCRT